MLGPGHDLDRAEDPNRVLTLGRGDWIEVGVIEIGTGIRIFPHRITRTEEGRGLDRGRGPSVVEDPLVGGVLRLHTEEVMIGWEEGGWEYGAVVHCI